jgi:CheY-like chemotaxis protein
MKRILAADDDEAILDVIEIILEGAGYFVTTTMQPEKVLTLKENLPDLILLDIWMAGVDGRVICRYLKDQVLTQYIPVILISANTDIEEIARLAGADDFICKPFDMDRFLIKVAKQLNK